MGARRKRTRCASRVDVMYWVRGKGKGTVLDLTVPLTTWGKEGQGVGARGEGKGKKDKDKV